MGIDATLKLSLVCREPDRFDDSSHSPFTEVVTFVYIHPQRHPYKDAGHEITAPHCLQSSSGNMIVRYRGPWSSGLLPTGAGWNRNKVLRRKS